MINLKRIHGVVNPIYNYNMCVRLCVRRRFRILIHAAEPARTVGFRDREPARTVGFQKREPVQTENGQPDRAGQGAGVRAGSGRGFEKTGFGRTGSQTGQGRAGAGGRAGRAGGQGAGQGHPGGLHSGLRPRAPTS
jgi:hypothetical protein